MSERGSRAVLLHWMSMMAIVALPLMACSSSPSVPDAEPMPEGMSFSGLWYSDQFQHMYLYQDGDRVEGVYGYGRGGTLEGTVEGNMLLFSWHEPGDRAAAVQDTSGKGYLKLRVDPSQPELDGQWGYEDNRMGGGPWTAEHIRPIEEGDPRTIEEFFQIH